MSQLLRDALKARLPMIRVTTEDPVNAERVLQSIAGKKNSTHIEALTAAVMYKADTLLYTSNAKLCTSENWELLEAKDKSLVFLNTELNTLMFDSGALVPPKAMVQQQVQQYTEADLTSALEGLDLKKVEEILRLTSSKFGNLHPSSIKTMRAMLGVPIQGLYPVDTKLEVYHPYVQLQEWLELNGKYFLAPGVSPMLRPRGVLLEGLPGTGKSAASKWIANTLGVPLYRLDVATSLGKYMGESEVRVMRILRQLEDYAPCVVLVDEVEKVFVQDADTGVVQRIMAQLLWWLAEHKSQVLTVMTTNDKSKIPPELFREGRVDTTMTIQPLTAAEATQLGISYLKLVVGNVTLKHVTSVTFDKKGVYTPVQVIQHVLKLVKSYGWGLDN